MGARGVLVQDGQGPGDMEWERCGVWSGVAALTPVHPVLARLSPGLLAGVSPVSVPRNLWGCGFQGSLGLLDGRGVRGCCGIRVVLDEPPDSLGAAEGLLAGGMVGGLVAPPGRPCRSRAPFPLPFVSISGLLQPPLPAATEPLPFPW